METNNKVNTVTTKIKISTGDWNLNLGQREKDPTMFHGTLTQTKDGKPLFSRISWRVDKFDCPSIQFCNFGSLTKENIIKDTLLIKAEILLQAKNSGYRLYAMYIKSHGNKSAKSEAAITTVKNTNTSTSVLSEDAKKYIKDSGCKTSAAAMNLAVKQLKEVNNTHVTTEQDVVNYLRQLDNDSLSEMLYEFLPADMLSIATVDEDIIPDPEPEDKMPIPKPDLNLKELKANLKSEILAELREELKASLIPVVKTEYKKAKEESTTTITEDDDINEDGLDVEIDKPVNTKPEPTKEGEAISPMEAIRLKSQKRKAEAKALREAQALNE